MKRTTVLCVVVFGLLLLQGCASSLEVAFRNRGSSLIWVDSARVGGHDVTPGVLAPGGGGKAVYVTGAGKFAAGSEVLGVAKEDDPLSKPPTPSTCPVTVVAPGS